MSFWKMDCNNLQSRPGEEQAEDSAHPESSLWAAHSLHAADSTAARPHAGSAARMQQHTFMPGATCSLDETDDLSVGFSVQQQASQQPPSDEVASKHAEQHPQQPRPLPAEELLLPELSSFAPYSTAGDGQQQSVQCSFDGIGYAIEQQVCHWVYLYHTRMHACYIAICISTAAACCMHGAVQQACYNAALDGFD